MQYPKDILEITFVDPICNTLIWVLTNVQLWPHIILRQRNLVQLQYLYLVYPIPIGVMQYHHECIKVQFKGEGIAWTKE